MDPFRKLTQIVQSDMKTYCIVYQDVVAWNQLKVRIQNHINDSTDTPVKHKNLRRDGGFGAVTTNNRNQ